MIINAIKTATHKKTYLKPLCDVIFKDFCSRLGFNMKLQIFKEFNGDQSKIQKFGKLFDNIYKDFRADTIFDLSPKSEFELYSRVTPNIKTTILDFKYHVEHGDVAPRVLNFCTGALHATEKQNLSKQILNS